MDIALMNVKAMIQKNSAHMDENGNHINGWEDFYSCHATAGGESGSEKAAAGMTVEDADISFTVRYCKKAAAVTADGFRILFGGCVYNIVSVDHMNYKKKALKFRCRKEGSRDVQKDQDR